MTFRLSAAVALLPVTAVLAAHQSGAVALVATRLAADATGPAAVASLAIVKWPMTFAAFHGESFRG